MYPVTAEQFAEIAGYSKSEMKSAYKELRAAADTVVGLTFYMDDAKQEKSVFVQSAKYCDGEGYVEIRFSYDVIPLISQLKEKFTMYLLEDVKGFKSLYGMRLFELIMQYKDFDVREVEIAWLRKIWSIEDKYPSMKDFKLRVIKPAIDDINKRSGWSISYTQRKTGRRVTHLQFEYHRKDNAKRIRRPKNQQEWDDLCRKHANPGETYAQARSRIQGLINKGEISLS